MTQTNLYAKEVMGEELYRSWKEVSPDELRALLGFGNWMGIVSLLSLDDCWSRDTVADRICRDQFRDISRYLHFTDS